MSYTKPASRGQSFLLVLNAFLNVRGLPFADVLSEEQIHGAFEKEDALFGQEEDDVYTPALTLFGFLSQVMHTGAERACTATVKAAAELLPGVGHPRAFIGYRTTLGQSIAQ